MKRRTNKIAVAVVSLLVSAIMLSTASYAWFAMNTRSTANGLTVEAYTDSNFLEISQTDEDSKYKTNTVFEDNNTGLLRLITNKRFTQGEIVTITENKVADGTRFTSTTTDTNSYYKAVKADKGTNYIYVPMTTEDQASPTAGYYKNPTFELVKMEGEAESGKSYFEFVNGRYRKVNAPTGSVKGYYVATHLVAEGADEVYDGTSVYYEAVTVSGRIELVEVTGLHLGTDLSQYYTIDATTVTIADDTTGDNVTDYYLKNGKDSKDYSYVGKVSAAELLKNYIYWGRAYSDDPTKVQDDQPLNVIDKADPSDYYLQKTVYLRQAEGTNHATNLKINDIKIGGATNALKDALRVLLVATSTSDPDNIVTVLYDAGTDEYNGQADGFVMYNTLLGNMEETIKVDVYIYFDGTDTIASNTTIAGATLNSQTIELEFTIDEHIYNK